LGILFSSILCTCPNQRNLCYVTMLHDIFNYTVRYCGPVSYLTMGTNVKVEQTASLSQYSCIKLLIHTYSGVHKSQASGHPGDEIL
jgi:hypothetical protein